MVCYIQKYVIILAGIFPLTSPPQPKYWGDVSPASQAALTPVTRTTELPKKLVYFFLKKTVFAHSCRMNSRPIVICVYFRWYNT